MPDVKDMDLVREYASRNSESAFAELVRRHINMVYSVALRFVGNSEDAQDVTQAVFIILAKKSGSLGKGTILTGWLYETTRFTAAKFLRTISRRRAREQEAYMQSMLNESDAHDVWRRLAPHLEDAMARLGERDRTLLALRFYENKSGAEAAALLGIREQAAHKRTARAVEKLRAFFARRGLGISTGVLIGAISANSVQAAPVMLAKSVTAVAIAKGATVSASTLTLIKGALKIMAWTKAKTALVVGAGVLLAAGTATVTIQKIHTAESIAAEPWRTPNLNEKILEQAPEQVRILPTKFQGKFGHEVRLRDNGPSRRVAGIDVTVWQLVSAAYYGAGTPVTAGAPSRTVFKMEVPKERYDFICTVPGNSRAALQQELKQQVGLVGSREMREMNVLLLRINHSGAPGLKPNPNVGAAHGSQDGAGFSFVAGRFSTLAGLLENLLDVPVIDQTGTAATFDMTLKFNYQGLNHQGHDPGLLKQALVDQLGLELVPGRERIEVLVVDKAN